MNNGIHKTYKVNGIKLNNKNNKSDLENDKKSFKCLPLRLSALNLISMKPYFLAFFIYETHRQDLFMNTVKNGFYELFLDFNTNREDVKKFFEIAISEKLQNLPEKAKIIRSFLFNQFPELFFKQRELRGKNTSLKNKLREFELEIFENNIVKNHKDFCIYSKGKLLVRNEYIEFSKDLCDQAILKTLGFSIPMEGAESDSLRAMAF
jgi:hypothetical protein